MESWSRLGGLLVGRVVESSWRLACRWRRHGGRATSSLHPPPLRRGTDSPVPPLSGCIAPEESVEHGCCCCGGRLLDFGAELLQRLSGATDCW